jgi:hypothetical protein
METHSQAFFARRGLEIAGISSRKKRFHTAKAVFYQCKNTKTFESISLDFATS